MEQEATQEPLIPIGEAARYIGVSVDTLRRWADAGQVAYVRTPSKQRRFLRSDLDAAMERVS